MTGPVRDGEPPSTPSGRPAPSLVGPPAAAAGAGQPAVADTAAKALKDPLDCNQTAGPIAGNGSSRLVVALADNIIWQPRDGEVRFTVRSSDGAAVLDKLHLRACFGWPDLAPKSDNTAERPGFLASFNLRTIERGNTYVTYGATLPPELWEKPAANFAPSFWDVWMDLVGQWFRPSRHRYDGWDLVPLMEMRIIARQSDSAAGDPNTLDTLVQVGLSYRLVALLWTLLGLAIVAYLLNQWAANRDVRGGPLLRIIANKDGYASLSQFQILLWTFVIGAGMVYVLALTGAMMDVPNQELALLGISGFSALTAAFKKQRDDPNSRPSDGPNSDAPTDGILVKPVRNARAISISATNALLFWELPDPSISNHTVALGPRNQGAGAPAIALPAPAYPFAIVSNLLPNNSYEFTIAASDGAHTSADTTVVVQTSVAPAAQPLPANLGVAIAQGDRVPVLIIDNPSPADAFIVQFRPLGETEWSTGRAPVAGFFGPKRSVAYPQAQLKPGTRYDFRIAAAAGGVLGAWSNVVSQAVPRREPRWSDLVVWDGQHEIDITRLQMLVFTALAAVFVTIKIGDEGALPQIPDGVILLMGLTNGVYVGGKFIGK